MFCNMPHATNPNDGAGEPPKPESFCRSYSVLLPVGFAVPPLLPAERCALTAPFHPYLQPVPWFPMIRNQEGGLFSVALSLRSPSPVVNRHRSSRGARTFLHCAQKRTTATVRPSGPRTLRCPLAQVKGFVAEKHSWQQRQECTSYRHVGFFGSIFCIPAACAQSAIPPAALGYSQAGTAQKNTGSPERSYG